MRTETKVRMTFNHICSYSMLYHALKLNFRKHVPLQNAPLPKQCTYHILLVSMERFMTLNNPIEFFEAHNCMFKLVCAQSTFPPIGQCKADLVEYVATARTSEA